MIFFGYQWTHTINLKHLSQSFFWIHEYGFLSVAVMAQSIIKSSSGDTVVPDLCQHGETVIMILRKFHAYFYQIELVAGECCIFEVFTVYLNTSKNNKI